MTYALRKYTGLIRTPSSMAWLIKQRASILGRIEHKNKQGRQLLIDAKRLQAKLQAIDAVMRQHEATVDPDIIQGRPTKRKPLVGGGGLGRFLLEQLREAKGQPCTTTDLAIGFLRSINADVTMAALKDARTRVRQRLKGLTYEGVVEARHQRDARGVFEEGLWALSAEKD